MQNRLHEIDGLLLLYFIASVYFTFFYLLQFAKQKY